MFYLDPYDERTFVKAAFEYGDNVCMIKHDRERGSWSVYEADPVIYDKLLGSFESKPEAFDFVRAHYAPDYPVASVYNSDGYFIYYKLFERPIGIIRKVTKRKWGIFIYHMGDEPVFEAPTLKECRESLRTSAEVEISLRTLDAVTPSDKSSGDTAQSGGNYDIEWFVFLAMLIVAVLLILKWLQ